MVTLSREAHPAKALLSMVVTLPGMVTFFKPVHPTRREGLRLVIPSWMTIFSRDVHPENGAVPMVVTPPGMEML